MTCSLASELMGITEDKPEPWLAMAHHADMKEVPDRAMQFVDKAILLDKRYPEGFILKGKHCANYYANVGRIAVDGRRTLFGRRLVLPQSTSHQPRHFLL